MTTPSQAHVGFSYIRVDATDWPHLKLTLKDLPFDPAHVEALIEAARDVIEDKAFAMSALDAALQQFPAAEKPDGD